MLKIKEVMRLRFELQLGYQQIGRSCAIAVSTGHKYLKREEAAGLGWPVAGGWDEARAKEAVFPASPPPVPEQPSARTPPDFATIHEQLRTRRHLTLQLLWEETGSESQRLSLCAFLRAVPALAPEARCGAAAGT